MPVRTIVAIASTRAQADAIGVRLWVAGLARDEVSILFSDKSAGPATAPENDTDAGGDCGKGGTNNGDPREREAEWPAGFGNTSSLGAQSLSGPIIASGPIRSVLGGGSVEDVVGALVGVGIPAHEARSYERQIRVGGILISIHTDDPDKARSARRILDSEVRPGSTGARA